MSTEVTLEMTWGTNRYRHEGVTLSGWPRKAWAWCEQAQAWEPCPNINVSMRIAELIKPAVPAHAAPVGNELAPDYFSPGTSQMHGKLVCSLWAIAYHAGNEYRYERERHGTPWRRTA